MNRIIEASATALVRLVGWFEVQRHRRQIYSVAVLALPLLTGASLVTDGQAQKVLAILAVLAGASVPGLARKHTLNRKAKP